MLLGGLKDYIKTCKCCQKTDAVQNSNSVIDFVQTVSYRTLAFVHVDCNHLVLLIVENAVQQVHIAFLQTIVQCKIQNFFRTSVS